MNATEERTQSDETEFLLAALRAAILRARLDINEFTSIGLALRSRMISPDGAIEWLQGSGLVGQLIKDDRHD
jgi:hypothetical protein